MAGWQNGRMSEWWNDILLHTYPAIFMVHDDDADNKDTDNDANDTNSF